LRHECSFTNACLDYRNRPRLRQSQLKGQTAVAATEGPARPPAAVKRDGTAKYANYANKTRRTAAPGNCEPTTVI
jgi:hypothetical protein